MLYLAKTKQVMRLSLSSFLAVLLFSALCFSCSKNNNPNNTDTGENNPPVNQNNPTEFKLKSGVVYFEEASTKHLIEVDDETIILKDGIPVSMVPAIGEIIMAAQGETTPSGFLGKVISVESTSEGKEVKTESVALDEVFEELSIDTVIDVSDSLDQLVDEEGNVIKTRDEDNSIWEEFEEDGEEGESTKAEYVSGQQKTKSIAIQSDFFSGNIILSTGLNVRVKIENGVLLDYDVQLKTATSITGRLTFEGEKNLAINTKTLRLPGAVMIGPIALRPAIVYGFSIVAEGTVKMDGPMTIGLGSSTTRWRMNAEPTTFLDKSLGVKSEADYLDCDGSIKFQGRVGFQFGVFSQNLLAFGVDCRPYVAIGLSGSMEMQDELVMSKNLEARISGSMGPLGVYFVSRFFSSKLNDEKRISIDTPELSYVVPLFDKGTGLRCEKKIEDWKLSGQFGNLKLMMDVEEKGYALFKNGQNNPVQLQAVQEGETKADTEVVFNIPDNPMQYMVRPYNRVKDYLFYGAPIGNYISRIVKGRESYYFDYDSNGRLTQIKKVESDGYETSITYNYSGESIQLVGSYSNGEIEMDSRGRIVSFTESFSGDNVNKMTFSYMENGIRINEKHTGPMEWEWYYIVNTSGGDQVSETIYEGESPTTTSYSFADHPNDYSIDFTHYFFDDLGNFLPPFLAFPGFNNEHLLESYTSSYYGRIPFSYTFDEKKRVSSVVWTTYDTFRLDFYYTDLFENE